MRILYVTDTRHGRNAWQDPSARHRCYHFADALGRQHNRVADVVNIRKLSRTIASAYDHIIFHRPKKTSRFISAFNAATIAGCVLHADYDDLIFEPSLAGCSPLYINGNRPLMAVEKYFTANRDALVKFDNVLVSTRALARRAMAANPLAAICVLPNSLPRLFSKPIRQTCTAGRFTVGYFPGSNSHGHDFDGVRDVLCDVLARHRNSRLLIVGKLSLDRQLKKNESVFTIPFSNYNRYLELLANVDVSIAPLERNPFNDCKSAVKLIESCAVGTPIIASGIDDMIDHKNPLCRIAENREHWMSTIEDEIKSSTIDKPENVQKNVVSAQLTGRFGVLSRLPIIEQHLSTTSAGSSLSGRTVANCV